MSVEDPNWPRASAWLRGEFNQEATSSLAIVGVPLNVSITPGQCEKAPAAIREALQRYSLFDAETQTDVSKVACLDHGEIEAADAGGAGFNRCVDQLRAAFTASPAAVVLGGDNAVTRLGVRAMDVPVERCGLLTFDAHHDLRDLDRGLTNGNPVRALLDDGMRGDNIVQLGIQPFANSPVYARRAREEGISVVTAEAIFTKGIDLVVAQALAALASKADAIYVDLDVDVLDSAFAPACPGARPGGLHPWMLRRAARMCGKHAGVRVLDIVEIDPTKDPGGVTCLAAASFLLAFASGLANRFQR